MPLSIGIRIADGDRPGSAGMYLRAVCFVGAEFSEQAFEPPRFEKRREGLCMRRKDLPGGLIVALAQNRPRLPREGWGVLRVRCHVFSLLIWGVRVLDADRTPANSSRPSLLRSIGCPFWRVQDRQLNVTVCEEPMSASARSGRKGRETPA